MKVIHVDAVGAVHGPRSRACADPEQKRKIIGREFVEVFQREAAKSRMRKWLAQGTIYPDVIESAGAKTKKARHDQVAPQRRRPARDIAPQAARSRCANCSRTRCGSSGSALGLLA